MEPAGPLAADTMRGATIKTDADSANESFKVMGPCATHRPKNSIMQPAMVPKANQSGRSSVRAQPTRTSPTLRASGNRRALRCP